MEENKTNGRDEIFSEKVKAGKRTYFFDVKSTRSNDYYLTITESKKRYNKDDEGFTYEKHKIFLYKEDFNKFMNCLNETIDHVKHNLMPDYNYDEFDREPYYDEEDEDNEVPRIAAEQRAPYGNSQNGPSEDRPPRWGD